MDLVQHEDIWPCRIIYEHWGAEKCTILSIYVQTHLATITINFQVALDKSALPKAETIIRQGKTCSVQPLLVLKTSWVAARLKSNCLRLSTSNWQLSDMSAEPALPF